MVFFTKDHCFVDGNKRVGIQSAILLLVLNGYEDQLEDEEGYKKTMEIAKLIVQEKDRDIYIKGLSNWLEQRFEHKTNIISTRRNFMPD